MVLNIHVRITIEVEVRVVGHVDHRLLVGSCCVSDIQSIIVGNGIGDNSCDISWEVVVTIRTLHGQLKHVLCWLVSLIYLILPS